MLKVTKGSGVQCFGDSFTMGYNDPSMVGYAQRLEIYIGGDSTNYGVGHSKSTTSALNALKVLPEIGRTKTVTFMAGLNDIRGGGIGALPKLEGNLRAFIVACFLNSACAANNMTRVGSWTALSNDYGSKAYYCGGKPLYQYNNLNAYLEWEFEGDNVVVGAYRTSPPGHYHDLAISVDGVQQDEFELFNLTNEIATFDAKVYRGFGAGTHTIRISPTTLDAFTTVDYVGTLADDGAPVFISEIPYLFNWAQYNSIATKEICDAANVVINNVVAEFAGLPIEIVKVNDFYNPITGCSSDGIHPTTAGHLDILEAFKDRIDLVEYLEVPADATEVIVNGQSFTPPVEIEIRR